MQVAHRVQLDHKDLMDIRVFKATRDLQDPAATRVQEEDRVLEDRRVFYIHRQQGYRVPPDRLVPEETRVLVLTVHRLMVQMVLAETRDR